MAEAGTVDTHGAHAHDAGHGHHEQSFVSKYIFSTDHKIIAMQYMFTGIVMALIGGYMSYAFRMQLAFPGESVPGYGVVSQGEYNALVTNHGTIMIFWVAMPMLIAAFGNYLIPLMIGADDMVFPRINRLSYQIFLISAIILIASFFVPGGGFGGAWTSYPPLSANAEYNLTPLGATFWLVAVALEFVAFLLGGINFITTLMNARAPGMKMHDIPMVLWMIVIASILFMASVGPLIAGAVMLFMDQVVGTGYFDPDRGGDPVLWQHLFWFFGHPEVYVVLLPAMGIVAEIICTFARKKLFNYKLILYTAFATGIISFFVWAHHQFVAGIDPRMANVFTITTLIISIPIAEMLFLYIATLYGGSIRLTTPMLWALSFIAEFLIGGITGIFLGASGSDIYFHDTYFVLAHFHYTFFPIAIIGFFAGITYWFPKMFGRMMNEAPRKDSLLGHDHRVQLHLHPALHSGCRRSASANLQLPELPRPCGHAGPSRDRDDRLARHARLPGDLPLQLRVQPFQGQARRQEPVEGQHARVDRGFTAAPRQLARAAELLPRPLRVQRARSRRRLLAARRPAGHSPRRMTRPQ